MSLVVLCSNFCWVDSPPYFDVCLLKAQVSQESGILFRVCFRYLGKGWGELARGTLGKGKRISNILIYPFVVILPFCAPSPGTNVWVKFRRGRRKEL